MDTKGRTTLKSLAEQAKTRVRRFKPADRSQGSAGVELVGVTVVIDGKPVPASAVGSSNRKALDALGRLLRGRNIVTGPNPSDIMTVPEALDPREYQ